MEKPNSNSESLISGKDAWCYSFIGVSNHFGCFLPI